MLLPEAGLIVTDAPLHALLQDERRRVFVCGPGLGPDAGTPLAQLIAAGRVEALEVLGSGPVLDRLRRARERVGDVA